MVFTDVHPILNTVPCIVTSEMRVWGNMREDGKDELVRELENCENGTGQVSIRSKELMEEPALRLVWGAGELGVVSRQGGMRVWRRTLECFHRDGS